MIDSNDSLSDFSSIENTTQLVAARFIGDAGTTDDKYLEVSEQQLEYEV